MVVVKRRTKLPESHSTPFIICHCNIYPHALPILLHVDSTMEKMETKVIGSRKTIKVGPWGGYGGGDWDDGCHAGIREITVVYDRCIDCIQVEYDKNLKPILAEKHGGSGGTRTAQIKLHPEEFLTCLSGCYSPVVHGGSPVIRSLTFKSNRRTFGPFGAEDGVPFMFPVEGGMIVGFHGRAGWYLDAIGVHLAPTRTTRLYDSVQQMVQRLSTKAAKSLGHKSRSEQGDHATAKTLKPHGA